MKKNNLLPSLRIDSELKELMNKALSSLNSNKAGLHISLQDFRRWSYKSFSSLVLKEGLTLEFKPR